MVWATLLLLLLLHLSIHITVLIFVLFLIVYWYRKTFPSILWCKHNMIFAIPVVCAKLFISFILISFIINVLLLILWLLLGSRNSIILEGVFYFQLILALFNHQTIWWFSPNKKQIEKLYLFFKLLIN